MSCKVYEMAEEMEIQRKTQKDINTKLDKILKVLSQPVLEAKRDTLVVNS